MSLLREAAKSILQPELSAMQEAIAQRDETLELLRERLAELELALEDTGWTRLGAGGEREFSRDALRRINQLARLYWLKNPLVKRAVLTQTQYVFGQGVTIQARHALVNEVIQEFLDDPKNQAELTSHQARMIKETELQCFGNLFFVFFVNKSTGRVRVRTIPVDEIEEIITNPEDSKEPWFYKRVWTQNRLDLATGRSVPETRTAYYPDWRYQPAGAKPMTIGGHPVEWDTPVFHVAVNKLSDMKFGVSEIYAAFDWARAYKEFLENWATIVKAYARFAWQVTTKGGAKGVTTVKEKFKTALTTQASETNPPPATASMFIGTEGVKLEPVRTAGATTHADDGRRLLLMVSAATGIFEHYFGDPSCYSADTEVLTDRGFMRHDEWKPGIRVACYNPETDRIEFHHPFELRVFDYEGDLIWFKNAQTDILVTPNHRMWTAPHSQWKRKPSLGESAKGRPGRPRVADGGAPMLDRSWRFEEARFLEANGRAHGWTFKAAAPYDGKHLEAVDTPIGTVDSRVWARFMGYWLSEGSTLGPHKRNGARRERVFYRVMLAQKPGPVLDEMERTLKDLGLQYHRTVAPSGVVTLTVVHKDLWTYLREKAGTDSKNKRIPRELLTAGEEERRALFDALMEGDGGLSGRSLRYSTASCQLADDMQQLALSLGFGATVTSETRKYRGVERRIWRVWIRREWTETRIKPSHVSRVAYSGKVYCFHLPHHIYVTRRNGKIAIQGNTGNLATAKSMERPMELMFRDRQELWKDVLHDILQFVVDCSARAPNGKIPGRVERNEYGEEVVVLANDTENEDPKLRDKPIDRHIDVTFPPLLEHDVESRVKAIVSAATLDGKPPAGTLELKDITRMLLVALGEDDIDEILDHMFPPKGEEQAQEPQEPPTVEAMMVEAVRELRKAVAELAREEAA
jgi:hypothetical protein